MCGRFYVQADDPEMQALTETMNRTPLAERFRQQTGGQPVTGGEVLPSAVVAAAASDRKGRRAVFPMRLGFGMPGSPARMIINARSETASEKPMFRQAWQAHRCAVPASWYFEWSHPTDEKGRKKTGQKYAIRPKEKGLVWLAGLYRIENDLPTFVVVTREPAPELAWMHDRMPLILPDSAVGTWIDPAVPAKDLLDCAVTEVQYQPI